MKSLATAAAAFAIALSMTGCSDDPPSTDNEPVAQAPEQPSGADRALIREARAAVRDARSMGADWASSITGIKVVDGVLWIETSLYPDGDADEPASAICGTMKASLSDFPGVTVRASDGQRLVLATSLSDPC